MDFESKLSSVRVDNKSDKQLSEIGHYTKFYKSPEEVIKCYYNDYFKMVHKAVYDAKPGKGLKILTLKQMLQILQIALAQVKTGNI